MRKQTQWENRYSFSHPSARYTAPSLQSRENTLIREILQSSRLAFRGRLEFRDDLLGDPDCVRGEYGDCDETDPGVEGAAMTPNCGAVGIGALGTVSTLANFIGPEHR